MLLSDRLVLQPTPNSKNNTSVQLNTGQVKSSSDYEVKVIGPVKVVQLSYKQNGKQHDQKFTEQIMGRFCTVKKVNFVSCQIFMLSLIFQDIIWYYSYTCQCE